MPNYRRDRQGLTYFFTVVAAGRCPVLCEEQVRNALHRTTLELKRMRPFTVDAWVLLPDHMHCIWTLPPGDADYSMRIGWLKKAVTKRTWNATPGLSCGSLWQPRFWEHRIRDDADYEHHCAYIHFNPVKHGVAKSPAEWPWSTIHRFIRRGIYPADWGGRGIDIPTGIGHE